MDYSNKVAFVNKDDIIGTTIYNYPEGSANNFVGGKFQIKNINSGNYYIGLRNPSTTTQVGIIIEAYAFVRKKTLEELRQEQATQQLADGLSSLFTAIAENNNQPTVWNTETKGKLIDVILNKKIGKDNSSSRNLSLCAAEAIISKYTYEYYYQSHTKMERALIIEQAMNNCMVILDDTKLNEELERKNRLYEIIDSLKIFDENKKIAEANKELLSMGFTENNKIYNTIGWYYLLCQDYKEANYFLRKCESFYPEDLEVQMNIAHLLLMTNDYAIAEKIYVKNKRDEIGDKKFKEIVKEDFNTFSRLGILPTDASKIKAKLGI
jgi:hypothetical protein